MSEEIDQLLERLMEESSGPQREEMLARFDAERREELVELLDAGDLVWKAAHSAPPLEKDQVAALLGVVPDPSFQLDTRAFAQACRTRGVKPTVLAGRLSARGWGVDTSDVFRWQTRSARDVPPALIKVISEEMGVDPERLVTRAVPQQIGLVKVVEDIVTTARFGEVVQRFAKVRSIPEEMAESAMKSRMLATVHRGDMPDKDQMLASLESLIHALETEQGR